jgi:sugar phosphate isomerase/epimerase
MFFSRLASNVAARRALGRVSTRSAWSGAKRFHRRTNTRSAFQGMPAVFLGSSIAIGSAFAFAEGEEAEIEWGAPVGGPLGEGDSLAVEKEYPFKKESNTVLSNRHRVALCGWPIRGARDIDDERVKDMHALFEHVWNSNYDGVEISVEDFRALYPETFRGMSDVEAAKVIKETAEDHGVSVLGTLYLVGDGTDRVRPWDLDFSDENFYQKMEEKLTADRTAGAEYVTYQIGLPPKYMNTGGAYRGDTEYYDLTVDRLHKLRTLANNVGLNIYFETHIERISEDPIAFTDIIERSETLSGRPFEEVNGDLSHYIYCGITKGAALDKILKRVNHMHQRMARLYGDFSSEVINPAEDWEAKGCTYTAFQLSSKALKGGLSSRTISGETGPIHLVTDTLTHDAKLVPLFRMMALYADGEITDQEVKNPFL